MEFLAETCGVSTQTILHYQEHGLIHNELNDEALRSLRRVEYLRTMHNLTLSGLKLLIGAFQELERLQNELRVRR